MIATPRHLFNHNVVLTSGMGFDSYAEVDYTGSVPVSGSGLLKTTDEFAVTSAGVQTITRTSLTSDPAELPVSVRDKIEVTSGPAVVSGTTYRVTNMRAVVDSDGFHVLDISQLEEVEV